MTAQFSVGDGPRPSPTEQSSAGGADGGSVGSGPVGAGPPADSDDEPRYRLRIVAGTDTIAEEDVPAAEFEKALTAAAARHVSSAQDAIKRGETLLVVVRDISTGQRGVAGMRVIPKGGDDAAS